MALTSFYVAGWIVIGMGAAAQAVSKLMRIRPRVRSGLRIASFAAALLCLGLAFSPMARDHPAGPWGEVTWIVASLVMFVAVMSESALDAWRRW
jgi:hypothetical protein